MRISATIGLGGILALGACVPVETTGPEPDGGGLPNPARSTCMAAVANQAGDGNVTVLSDTSAFMGGSEIVVGVGETRAPWRCRTGADGAVREVTPVADPAAG
jgi:hypothetical protein